MDSGDKELQLPEASSSKEEQASVGSSSTGERTIEEEEDYVPEEGENSIDDETTLAEQESLENETEIAEEVAALQEEQDIPVEELMRIYGYNNVGSSSSPATSSGPSTLKAADQQYSRNADSFSSPSSSSHCEASSTMIAGQFQRGHSYFAVHGAGDNGKDADEDDEEDQEGGPSNEHGYFSTSDEDSENDYDYIPEEAWRKDIKVGPEHQAEVPDSVVSDEVDSQGEPDECMWFPNATLLREEAVEEYLKSALVSNRSVQNESRQPDSKTGSGENTGGGAPAAQFSLKRKIECLADGEDDQQPIVHVRDDETALKLLYESQYDIEMAQDAWKRTLLERKRKEISPDDPDRTWTEEEQNMFEDGLKAHGKNFRLIQQEFLPNRTTKDLVRYYYLWKRTERHDIFVQTYRFEKRQCSLHPTASDYMDHFLDHMALVGATTSVAASAFQPGENSQNIHALQQSHHYAYLSLLPSNTNARHHLLLAQGQKAESEEVVVAEDLNNASDPVNNEGGEMNNHSSRDYAL